MKTRPYPTALLRVNKLGGIDRVWPDHSNIYSCGGGRRAGLALCPECRAPTQKRACPNCGYAA